MPPPPPRKFGISDLLRSFLVPFWGEIARVGQPTAKSIVIVFEAFKCLQNLRTWLRFTLQRLQRSHEAQKKKKENCSQQLFSFSRCSVELRDTNTSMWLLCISSVSLGSSVCSYICAHLLSIHECSSSKKGFHGTHGTPLDPPLHIVQYPH